MQRFIISSENILYHYFSK